MVQPSDRRVEVGLTWDGPTKVLACLNDRASVRLCVLGSGYTVLFRNWALGLLQDCLGFPEPQLLVGSRQRKDGSRAPRRRCEVAGEEASEALQARSRWDNARQTALK